MQICLKVFLFHILMMPATTALDQSHARIFASAVRVAILANSSMLKLLTHEEYKRSNTRKELIRIYRAYDVNTHMFEYCDWMSHYPGVAYAYILGRKEIVWCTSRNIYVTPYTVWSLPFQSKKLESGRGHLQVNWVKYCNKQKKCKSLKEYVFPIQFHRTKPVHGKLYIALE